MVEENFKVIKGLQNMEHMNFNAVMRKDKADHRR